MSGHDANTAGGEDFDLLRHFGVSIHDAAADTNRSLAGAFAGVASSEARRHPLSANMMAIDDDVDTSLPSNMIAHHRRLRAHTGHMDNSLNPLLGHMPLARKQHAEQKLRDHFDGGSMVPAEGSESPLIPHSKNSPQTAAGDPASGRAASPWRHSNLSNTGMTPRHGSNKDDLRPVMKHAGMDTESKLSMQSCIPVSLQNEQHAISSSIAFAGIDTKSNIVAHENGFYPADGSGY